MEPIEIPSEHVIPLESVTDGVQGLRIAFVNVFSIAHSDGAWTLIDAGLKHGQALIRRWIETHHGRPPNAILLTHGHFDHVGAAAELADEWDVPILAHEHEFPYLNGEREYPRPDLRAGGGLMTLLSPLYPRGPFELSNRLRVLPAEEQHLTEIAEMPGWQVLHTPGHTPGHVSLFRVSDRTLLPGDAFCTTKPESFFEAAVAQPPELHGPPAYFTMDWSRAQNSVARLAMLNPMVVAPGHGKALYGERVPAALHELAERFAAVAVPEHKQ